MELVKAHNILLAVPSRWPPIMLGVIISLILSAIFTFNFSSRVTPVPESITSPKLASSQESASPSEHTSFSSQLIILLIRNFYSKQSFSSKRDPNLSRSLNLSSQSSIQSTRSFSQITSSPNYAGGTIWHPGDGRKVGSNVLRDIGSSPSQDTYPVEKTVGGKALTDSNTSTVTASQSDSTSHSIDESSIADQAVASKPRSGGAISNLTWNTTNDHLIDRSIKGMKPDLKRPVNSIQHMVEQFPTALSSTRTEMNSDYCDISKGKWVEDDSGPLYPPGTCPFVDESFNCYGNGRPDSRYSRWRWAPMDCNIPRFNGTFFLERLRGKRLVFVGDSLNRNQWESMLCMLREWLPDKKRIQQINGGRISKLPGAYVFKFLDYDCKVEFYTSHYLVDIEGEDDSNFIVKLDKMDKSERRWRKASILVFNTGHWWTADKIGEGDDRFQEGAVVHEKMNISIAFHKALSRWSKWVDTYVKPNETTVFFRGYSPVHYTGGQWNSGGQCQNETEPIYDQSFLKPYPKEMQVLDEILQGMKVPVQVLNITRLSDFRKDGHPAIYGHSSNHFISHQDCSHWCLPGVPDIWNEILYSALLSKSIQRST